MSKSFDRRAPHTTAMSSECLWVARPRPCRASRAATGVPKPAVACNDARLFEKTRTSAGRARTRVKLVRGRADKDLPGRTAPRRCRVGYLCEISELGRRVNRLTVGAKLLAVGHAPRRRLAISRTSSLSILYLSVLKGMPRYSAVPVTFHAHFSSA